VVTKVSSFSSSSQHGRLLFFSRKRISTFSIVVPLLPAFVSFSISMFQEAKRSATPDEQYTFPVPSSSFSTQHPLFRDISDLPRSVAPDFVSSSSTLTSTPDVYRSIEQPTSSGGLFAPENSWVTASDVSSPYLSGYGLHKELDLPSHSLTETYGWNDPYTSIQQFEKTKAIEDLRSPLIQSFPASNLSVVNTVPPAVPEYVDPSYHFTSKTQATELYQSIAGALKCNGFDVESKPEKFRMKCKSYPNGSLLYFIVRIFRDSKKSECVVECQRRSGDVIRFSELYKSLKRQLDPNFRETGTATRKDLEINHEHAQETTQCLLLMASSHFVDVKSKAVQALASLSGQDRTVQDILIKNGSVSLLLDGCAKFSKVEDVHRPSLTALANLSEGRADVCRAIAEKSLRCISDYTNKETPQVVRECARVLTNVGHNLKDTMRDVDCISDAVKNLSRSSDPVALQCARELEDCIEGMN